MFKFVWVYGKNIMAIYDNEGPLNRNNKTKALKSLENFICWSTDFVLFVDNATN